MLGRVKVFEPVCSCRIAPPCATLSPTIERMMHRSSAHAWRRWGNSSLTAMPLCPYLRNCQGDFSRLPDAVFGKSERAFERQRLAVVAGQARLGIERVHVRGTAVHEQKDHALGLGRKVRLLWRKWIGRGCRQRRFAKTDARPMRPKPQAERCSKYFATDGMESLDPSYLSSVYVDKVVRCDQCAGRNWSRQANERYHRRFLPGMHYISQTCFVFFRARFPSENLYQARLMRR